jgi:hypothetical protein
LCPRHTLPCQVGKLCLTAHDLTSRAPVTPCFHSSFALNNAPPWPLSCFFPICLRLGRQRFPRTSRAQIEWSRTASHSLASQNPPEELRISVPAVLNALFLIPDLLSAKSHAHNFKQQFQQLGHDLQTGNLTQAQSDFDAIQPSNVPGLSSSSSSSGLVPAFNQLATDLKSGNLPAAQKDYAAVQQDLEQSSAASGHHHHSAGSAASSISQNSLEQLFSRLGQDLQSENLSKAQSAYTPLQQEFAQLSSALSSTLSSAASSNALNVTV